MELYELPQFKSMLKRKKKKKRDFRFLAFIVLISIFSSFLAGTFSSLFFYSQIKDYVTKVTNQPGQISLGQERDGYSPQTMEEKKVVDMVREASPAVVSIVITKEIPVTEQYYERDFFGRLVPRYRDGGTEKQEVGGGTGFIISEDGLVVTNKHVVDEEDAEYTVLTNTSQKFEAEILAKDPVQDLAVLKIKPRESVDGEGNYVVEKFPIIRLGDSEELEIGQTVVAIGNALGEFRNTVSAGVVSGLGRKITASDTSGSFVETLDNVIQTDAAINKGNSGGPLLNLKGEVIGINTAVASGAQSVGFAIPINKVKRAINQVKEIGEIIYPFIGIRYVLVNESVQDERDLSVDYGALIVDGGEPGSAIWPDSPAEEAGLKKDDIVLEIDGERITIDNPLSEIILKYNPDDEVTLRVLREEEEIEVKITLTKRPE